jgi:hypothetical protein
MKAAAPWKQVSNESPVSASATKESKRNVLFLANGERDVLRWLPPLANEKVHPRSGSSRYELNFLPVW